MKTESMRSVRGRPSTASLHELQSEADPETWRQSIRQTSSSIYSSETAGFGGPEGRVTGEVGGRDPQGGSRQGSTEGPWQSYLRSFSARA